MSKYDKLFAIQTIFSIKYSFSLGYLMSATLAPQDVIIDTILCALSIFMIIFIGLENFISSYKDMSITDIFFRCTLIDMFLLIAAGYPTLFFESESVYYTGLTIIILEGFSYLCIDKYNDSQEIVSEDENKYDNDYEIKKKKYVGKNKLFLVHGDLHLLEVYIFYEERGTQEWLPGEYIRSSAINVMNSYLPYKIFISLNKTAHEQDRNILFLLREEAIEFESDLCYQINIAKFFSSKTYIKGLRESSGFEPVWCNKFLISKDCCTELKEIPTENRINNLKLNLF